MLGKIQAEQRPMARASEIIFLGSDIFRGSVYGRGHPLNIARVWPVIDISRHLGWLDDRHYVDVPPASAEQLHLFHSPDYVQALLDAEANQCLDEPRAERHRIGRDNNPIFPQVYSRPATAAHASLIGADLLLSQQAGIVFNPSGGTHHGFPDRANGFCFVNDPVLGLLRLKQGGAEKIAYIDIDAHHPDGVEASLSSDPVFRLFSIHEENRWPRTGQNGSRGGGYARNFTLNRGASDSDFLRICEGCILPELDEFCPDVLVLQAGCDGLSEDPQSGLCLTNHGYWAAVRMFLDMGLPSLILGGGGYNPFTTARAWTGVWGIIAGQHPETTLLPEASRQLLTSLDWAHRRNRTPNPQWFDRLYDERGVELR